MKTNNGRGENKVNGVEEKRRRVKKED